MTDSDARAIPEDGDIVVREQTRDGKWIHVLHTAGGPDQVLLRTRDEAIAQACGMARMWHVRAWLANGDEDFVLLEDVRVVESV